MGSLALRPGDSLTILLDGFVVSFPVCELRISELGTGFLGLP
jgi:hypothetical protein